MKGEMETLSEVRGRRIWLVMLLLDALARPATRFPAPRLFAPGTPLLSLPRQARPCIITAHRFIGEHVWSGIESGFRVYLEYLQHAFFFLKLVF